MNRRGFFKAIAAPSVMVMASWLKFDDGIALNSVSHPMLPTTPNVMGFAQAKPEGGTVAYDHVTYPTEEIWSIGAEVEEIEIDIVRAKYSRALARSMRLIDVS